MSNSSDVDYGPPSRRRGSAAPQKGSGIWKWGCGGCAGLFLIGCVLIVVAVIAGVNWVDEKLEEHLGSHPVFAKHPKGAPDGVTFSPDGGRIATASAEGTIAIWNAETAEKITSFDVKGGSSPQLWFSPDGTRLAIDGAFWDAASGKKLNAVGELSSGKFNSPDGTRLAGFTQALSVQVWDAKTGEKLFVLKCPAVRCVAFSPDGSRLVTGSDDRAVRLWDAATGEEVRKIELKMQAGAQERDEIRRVWFSGDGKQVLGVGWSGSWTWDAATGNEIRWTSFGLTADRSNPNTRAFNPATKQVVAAYDNWVHVVDATTGQITHKLRTTPNLTPSNSPGMLRSVAISPDGTRVVGGGRDGNIRVWKLNK